MQQHTDCTGRLICSTGGTKQATPSIHTSGFVGGRTTNQISKGQQQGADYWIVVTIGAAVCLAMVFLLLCKWRGFVGKEVVTNDKNKKLMRIVPQIN